MLNNPPREKEAVSWLYVSVCSMVIFATIPLARTMQEFVKETWGRETFSYIVIGFVIVAIVAGFNYLRRLKTSSGSRYAWLIVISFLFIGYTIRLSSNPEEALHFVEYGLLGLLLYRALTHRTRDISIYFKATVIGAMIGMMDEAIQWAIPKRFWGLDDIWLNFFAVALTQVAIARGLRPAIISGRPSAHNLRRLCILTAMAVLFLGASLLNTPARVAWYTERVPALKFLIKNESMMFEYGHFYRDPEIGHFRSRLSPEELEQTDRERAEEAAAVLNQYRNDSTYSDFLIKYTPVSDPFLHEARVHLFRRDRYMQEAEENKENEEIYRDRIMVAYRENLIMEKYFTHTFRRSNFVLPPEQLAYLEENHLPELHYGSGVSWRLVTETNEFQIMTGLFAVLLGLGFVYVYFGRERKALPASSKFL